MLEPGRGFSEEVEIENRIRDLFKIKMNKEELIAEFGTLSAVGFRKEIIRLLPLS